MTFQKGNTLGKGYPGPKRQDMTIELITQLNEVMKCAPTEQSRTYMNRIIYNLIKRAATYGDEYNDKGELIKEGFGDLQAILAIFERIEGKPKQQITGPDDGPVQVQYRTIEEVRMFLLEQGIDAARVPPPPLKLISNKE